MPIASVHGDDERPGRVEQQMPREQPRKSRARRPARRSTKSRARSDRISARATRAVSIHPTAPTSTTSSATDGASTAPRIMRSSSRGTDSIASVKRMSTLSSPPAGVAGHAADHDADAARHQSRKQADGKRDARAMQHARQHVTPEFVGAKPVRRRRRRAPVGEIQIVRLMPRDHRRRRSGDEEHEQDKRSGTAR